jgi:hypothetical protein
MNLERRLPSRLDLPPPIDLTPHKRDQIPRGQPKSQRENEKLPPVKNYAAFYFSVFFSEFVVWLTKLGNKSKGVQVVSRNMVLLTFAATIAVIGLTLGGIAVSLAAYSMLLY